MKEILIYQSAVVFVDRRRKSCKRSRKPIHSNRVKQRGKFQRMPNDGIEDLTDIVKGCLYECF